MNGDVTMADANSSPRDTPATRIRLPWFVTVSPEYYDDSGDTGYGWEGWATDAEDAVTQALEECHLVNHRDAEEREEDVDQEAPRSMSSKSTSAVSPGPLCTGRGRWAAGRRRFGKPWKRRLWRPDCLWHLWT